MSRFQIIHWWTLVDTQTYERFGLQEGDRVIPKDTLTNNWNIRDVTLYVDVVRNWVRDVISIEDYLKWNY